MPSWAKCNHGFLDRANIMARTLASAEDLRELLRVEAVKYAACDGVVISRIELQEPDATGCNWRVSGVRGSGDSAATAKCVQALTVAIEDLQALYNLPETE